MVVVDVVANMYNIKFILNEAKIRRQLLVLVLVDVEVTIEVDVVVVVEVVAKNET